MVQCGERGEQGIVDTGRSRVARGGRVRDGLGGFVVVVQVQEGVVVGVLVVRDRGRRLRGRVVEEAGRGQMEGRGGLSGVGV